MIPISWMPLKLVNPIARNAAGGGQAAGENALPGKHHRLGQRRFLALAVPQFLLVAGDQVHAVINGQADQDRHEGDRQDVQVADRPASQRPACSPGR